MTAISFENISKTFRSGLKRNTVLKGLNLTVNDGEIFGFLGPNGAGKSTSIKLLLDFIRPDRGRITVDGFVVGKERFQHLIGYLPETPCFFENLSGMETLLFAARASEMRGYVIKKRAQEVLERLDLKSAGSWTVRTYSKGMKQRLGLAMALIHDPDIYILDEPMSGLDPLGRNLISDVILDLGQNGKTVFFSSHILSDAERLCDRIGILHKGELLFDGAIEDITEVGGLEKAFIKIIEEHGKSKNV
ncbi:MAG TPA: ABC transporter ATP-binding protein [Desulfobacteraceae bacterium]|nr:ABC transporter ATP-binding protein [Desulfobacteraceae bacterium]HPJ68961.1 ABC transporter ATP-binding protein [Desulfobacteraceae bacterium]HPQ29954.1 ABC transporter ATP-binding protein [Desulfobacteraceae bacterium]